MTKCAASGCSNLPVALVQVCWAHLEDKEGYKVKLIEAVKRGEDLSGANLSQVELAGAHLFDAKLKGAHLIGADLSNCDLMHCDLRDADLTKANLANARLWNADLSDSNLTECDLSCADLWNAKLFNVKLWHAVLTGVKSLSKRNFSEGRHAKFFADPRINETGELAAEESYRDLKRYFMANGIYNDVSWASFKEKSVERLIMKKNLDPHYIPSLLMNILCGYGEKPYRIVLASLSTIILFSVIYFLLNAIESSSTRDYYLLRWSDYLYYSTITYTTVGYGDFIPKPHPLFRILAASEAFIGVFLTGLFIFTLARKYSAR